MALADKGTLFLDELSAFPYSLQAKILRAVQERKAPFRHQQEIDELVNALFIPWKYQRVD